MGVVYRSPSSKKNVNYKLVSERLANVNWEQIITNDIEKSWSNVKTVILHAEKSCTRIFWAKQAKSLLFLTTETSKLINRKHWAWNCYKKKKTSENYQFFKTLCNQTTNHIKQLKSRFEEQLAEDVRDNPKFFCHYTSQNVAADALSLISYRIVNQLLILSWKLKFATNNLHLYFPPIPVLFFPHFLYIMYHILWNLFWLMIQ